MHVPRVEEALMNKLVGSLALGGCWLLACGGRNTAAPAGSEATHAPKADPANGGDFGASTAPPQAGGPSGGSPAASSLPAGTCLSLASRFGDVPRIATVALDTGIVTLGAAVTLANFDESNVTSLGLIGDDLYACAGGSGPTDRTVHTIHRVTGAVVATNVACGAVTTDGSALWLLEGTTSTSLTRYADLGGAQAKQMAAAFPIQAVESIGPGKETLFGAWHSDAKVLRIVRSSGATTPLELEGFAGWIFGLSSASGGRLVISTPSDLGGEGVLAVFDGKTGKRIGRVGAAEPDITFHGVVCADGGEAAPPTKLPSEPR
jgi:hypothetical protein